MDGIFHKRVIICESDADCLFYSALLDLEEVHGENQPDVLFIHASGKHRIAALAQTLTALDVPVDIIADFDLLRDPNDLGKIVTALGADCTEISAICGFLKKIIEDKNPPLSVSEVANQIEAILNSVNDSVLGKEEMKSRIDDVFRSSSPWAPFKTSGASALPGGDPTKKWQTLNSKCRDAGLWVVPVGELEGFCRSVGGHGPRWVQNVFSEQDICNSGELAEARNFLKEIWQSRLS